MLPFVRQRFDRASGSGGAEAAGAFVFGVDDESLEAAVLAALRQRGETVAVVECGTGGRLASKLAAGAAEFVSGRLLATAAAEPLALARQAADETGADWGLACVITQQDGEVWLDAAFSHRDFAESLRRGYGGHIALAAEWSANLALDSIRQALLRD